MPKRTQAYMLDKRREIVAAAIRCFGEHGPQDAAMADIAARAGVSAGALYRHFDSKEAILVEAIRTLVDQFYAEPAPASWPDARTRLVAYARLGDGAAMDHDTAIKHAVFSHGTTLVALRNVTLGTLIGETRDRAERWTLELLERLAAKGEIALPLGATDTASLVSDYLRGVADGHPFTIRSAETIGRILDTLVGFTGSPAGTIALRPKQKG